MDSSVFLEDTGSGPLKPVYVVHGDEDFLKRRVLAKLRRRCFGEEEESLGWSVITGDKADFAAVRDELSTLGFLSAHRLVQIDQADTFVTNFRAQLEKYVAEPSTRGVLVLDVKSWPSNTRLAKLVPADATLVCKTLPMNKLPEWCARWARSSHGKQMSTAAARLLVDLIGEEMGLLDQELAKLAVYAGSASKIEADDVDRLVGNSRAENTWKIFDHIGAGRMDEALKMLDRLFDQGEEPAHVSCSGPLACNCAAWLGRLPYPVKDCRSARHLLRQESRLLPFGAPNNSFVISAGAGLKRSTTGFWKSMAG